MRLALVRAAIRGQAAFRASSLELKRGGVSYTLDTVRAVHAVHPTARLFLLIGADMLNARWHGLEELQHRCTFLVAPRTEGSRVPERQGGLALAMPRLDLSSSMIRERIRRGQSIRYLVPDAVARLIARRRLYAAKSR